MHDFCVFCVGVFVGVCGSTNNKGQTPVVSCCNPWIASHERTNESRARILATRPVFVLSVRSRFGRRAEISVGHSSLRVSGLE